MGRVERPGQWIREAVDRDRDRERDEQGSGQRDVPRVEPSAAEEHLDQQVSEDRQDETGQGGQRPDRRDVSDEQTPEPDAVALGEQR